MPVAGMAIMVIGGLSMLSSAFVSAPNSPSESLALRGTALAASVASVVPEPAHAFFTEKEQYQFGLVFIPFFMVFYVAALVRMLTLGKL